MQATTTGESQSIVEVKGSGRKIATTWLVWGSSLKAASQVAQW